MDTAYAIALASSNDRFHALAEELEVSGARIVTSRAVLLEIGNALSKQRYRYAAIVLLESLESDPAVDIVPLSEALYARAIKLFRGRRDKEWGLTDCIAIVVMRARDLSDVLKTDEHFFQAGFRPLLRGDLE